MSVTAWTNTWLTLPPSRFRGLKGLAVGPIEAPFSASFHVDRRVPFARIRSPSLHAGLLAHPPSYGRVSQGKTGVYRAARYVTSVAGCAHPGDSSGAKRWWWF